MKRSTIYVLAIFALLPVSCSDFLDTWPKDALSPATTWKTEDDAEKFLIGCYRGWIDGNSLHYWDCASDIGYNYHVHEGWQVIGNGSFTSANTGTSFYSYTNIRRCLTFLENIDKVPFTDEAKKKDIVAQVRVIQAWCYFNMAFWYGGVPIIKPYSSADEAKVPRNTEQEVIDFVYSELDEAIPDLNDVPTARGRIGKGAAMAIKMRAALYWGDYERAKEAAESIVALRQYELDTDYANLFNIIGQSSKEIIMAAQYVENLYDDYTIGQMYNNAEGGWSSIVPTQNLVDIYEMADGTPRENAADYDPVHPFKNRDPRLALTILFPGQEVGGQIFNTLDEKLPNGSDNLNYPTKADNASKTALTWKKYLYPMEQYADIWSTSACPIAFRYAEVLLTIAEASNELSGPAPEVYEALDAVRTRVGMPAVDRSAYATKEALRELIRRERTVEFAGEGLRRADLVRWKDDSGKMLAETALNGNLNRIVGTVDYTQSDPALRATVNLDAPAEATRIETRTFAPHNRYFPFPQSSIDKNPLLKQNPNY